MVVKVKSALRVLEILDYFDEIEREASVNEIAAKLHYPISSTSLLLRQMFEMGYLNRGATGRNYVPSIRVTTLGIWVDPSLGADGPVMRLMRELSKATSALIILATRRGDTVRYIHIIPAAGRVRVHIGAGTSLPLAISCVGRVFMAQLQEKEVRQIIFRHNQRADLEKQIRLTEVLDHLGGIRRRGYGKSLEAVMAGISGLAVMLPADAGPESMVIAIGGVSEVVNENYLAWSRLMVEGVHRTFDSGKLKSTAN
jgi:IclR family acetate operon transcriptional repressor